MCRCHHSVAAQSSADHCSSPPPPSPVYLARQLEFYQALFRVGEGAKIPSSHTKVYSQLLQAASSFLSRSAYHVVDAAATFGYIDKMRKPGSA